MDFLKNLTEDERTLVLEAPALVTVLIGSADNNFTKDEEIRAKKAAHFRSIQGDPLLFDYFSQVDKDFDRVLDHYTQKFENDTDAIANKLSELNGPLKKLDTRYAAALTKNLRSIALAVAESSGGLLGFLSVSKEEAYYADLKMIEL